MNQSAKSPFNKKYLALAVGAAIVSGSLVGCGGSSSSSSGGGYTLSTAGGNGGSGATGYGGDADDIGIYTYGSWGGIEVKRGGSASAGFSSQINKITPFYGLNPLEVTSDTTVEVPTLYTAIADGGAVAADTVYVGTDGVLRTSGAAAVATNYATDVMVSDGSNYRSSTNTSELYTATGDDTTADLAAAGTPYFQGATDAIYLADGDDTTADAQATGLHVASGATLTLELNDTTEADIDFDNDVLNEGTITTDDYTATDRGDLRLYPDGSLINKGTITTAGSGTVVNGGFIDIYANYSAISSGAINSAGADNTAGAGGNGGYISLESGYYTENTGDWDASGGNGSTGNNGGSADWAWAYSDYGAVRNSGNVNLTGGNGDAGGSGDWFGLYNYGGGDVLNSGDIDTSGGTGSVTSGGSAGDIDLYGYGGRLASSGNITAVGGDAAADNNAGSGGYYYLYNSNGYASWDYGTTAHEGIDLSGDIMLTGGNSSGTGNGGSGGWFYAETDPRGNGSEYTAIEEGITLYGYTTIDSSGGDGQFPGEGAEVSFYADYGWDDSTYTYGATGPVTNGADIIASAGTYTGSADTGAHWADGGNVYLETSYYYGDLNPQTKVTNTGDITSNGAGGKNTTSNSYLEAGGLWWWGFNGVNNSGTITVNGGDDASADDDTTSRGGNSGWVELYAELGPVVNSGNITSNGGDAEYDAGYGSSWTAFYGPTVRNSGNITGIGGEADTTLANYYPGYGGWVWMMGTEGPSAVSNSGTITLTPGTNYTTVNPDENGYYKVIGAACSGDC